MNFKRKVMRYAHSEGHTYVCFSDDGSRMMTCGSDGDFRVWAGLEDDDPSSQCVGEWALCVLCKENKLYLALDNNTVQSYTYPDCDKDTILLRFTAPASHLALGPKLLVAGAQDFEIRITPLTGGEFVTLSGHEGPILSVAICPTEKYVASSSSDGTLKVWSVEDKNQIKQYNCVPRCNSFAAATVLAMPSFEPVYGKYLAYPSDKEIVLLDTSTWERLQVFSYARIDHPFSLCSFSPCGLYIAGSTTIGQICVWNVATQKCEVFSEHPNSYNVCSLAWNPLGNGELAFCDAFGQLGTIEDCYGANEPVESPLNNELDLDLEDNLNFPEDDESDNENIISLEKIKNETLKADNIELDNDRASSSASVHRKTPVIPLSQLQPPFQSGSTPTHLEHRYMVWNNIGIVRSHTSENENSIEVEFHDSLTHHGIHMNNYLNHTMACLSSTVLALACETPSKLVCITLGASGREWTTEMSQDEEILAIGAGEKLVAVATDNRSLRLFTAYGTQREIIAIPGPVVCLAGHGDKMLVAYHNTSALIGDDQNISLMFLQAIGMKLKCIHMNLPLGPGAKLTWLGFTDKGSPAFFDSLGVLKIYNTSYGVWMPLCNTASHVKGVSDRFFIIEVSETKQVLYAVLCRGSSYPQTVPRPAVAELPLEFPMCEMETDKSRFEEQLCRWSLWNADPNEKQFKEIAVKLFALACRSELEQRAQELIELIGSRDLLDLAIKYASRLGRMHLADRLTTMAKTIEERPKTPLTHVDHSNDISVDINTPITFNSSLINRTEERTTPIITPLAVKQSQNRNPFKRSLATNFGTPSPLQHLTDKVMGFKNSPTFTPEFTAESKTSESAGEISEKFPDWFEREKANLANEYPNKTTEELTKIALKLYKSRGNKRKLSDEQENLPTNTKQSKLSAFAYTKS